MNGRGAWARVARQRGTSSAEAGSRPSANIESTSWYVEDGSYLRMQNLAIGYNLPLAWFNNKVSRARVYVSTNNVFTISGYKGLDPGVGGAVDTNFGIDIGNYPVTRSFMFGAGFTF